MRKLSVTVITIFAITGYWFISQDQVEPNSKLADSSESQQANSPYQDEQLLPNDDQHDTSKSFQQLARDLKSCRTQARRESAKSTNIHDDLIEAFQNELKSGKSFKELYGYSHQYETYYSDYFDLLVEAQKNIERDKYDISQSVSEIKSWKGIDVIKGFKSDEMTNLLNALQHTSNKRSAMKFKFNIDKNVDKKTVLLLPENTSVFNTYIESPLIINGSSVVSPSILFLSSAYKLGIDEFQLAIAGVSFTVNDLAIAILNDLPLPYMKQLIPKTQSLNDTPVFVQTSYDTYENVADIAVAKHNLPVLKLLEQAGVYATKDSGIVTALDIAIMNLPRAYNASSWDSSNAKATISHLVDQGYFAHGRVKQSENGPVIWFKAPFRRLFTSDQVIDKQLRSLLSKIELVSIGERVERKPPDNSNVSQEIKKLNSKIAASNQVSKRCKEMADEIKTREGLADLSESYARINEVKKSGLDTMSLLHDIDPALVQIWRSRENRSTNTLAKSRFYHILKKKNYAQAREYSANITLDINETDYLLLELLKNPAALMPVWQARVNPQAPTGLYAFRHLPLKQWQILADLGFDFSIKDQHGNDLFLAVARAPKQIMAFLYDVGASPSFDHYGSDVFDVLLEISYQSDHLSPAIELILKDIKQVEASHYARIKRIQEFYPDVYEQLIKLNSVFKPAVDVEKNRYQYSGF